MSFKINVEYQQAKDNVNQSSADAGKVEPSRKYNEEWHRLDARIIESEKIWEDRTFGIAAGGLSLSFTIFSFWVGQHIVQSISCCMFIIWAAYVVCLILNYLSHRISVRVCRKIQKNLNSDKEWGLPYDVARIKKYYEDGNKIINAINLITEILLVISVLSTLFYTYWISVQ